MTEENSLPTDNTTDPMLQYFQWRHLPENLRYISKDFAAQAAKVVRTLPRCPERTEALRHLLEAKDCAVRAALPSKVVTVYDLE